MSTAPVEETPGDDLSHWRPCLTPAAMASALRVGSGGSGLRVVATCWAPCLHLLGGLRCPLLQLLIGWRRMIAAGKPCQCDTHGKRCTSA